MEKQEDESLKALLNLYGSPCRSKQYNLQYKLFACTKMTKMIHNEVSSRDNPEHNEHIEQTFFLLDKYFSWLSERLDFGALENMELSMCELDEYYAGCALFFTRLTSRGRNAKRIQAKKKDLEELNNYLYSLIQEKFIEKSKRFTQLQKNATAQTTEDAFSPLMYLVDPEGKAFWSENFGPTTFMVPWKKFEKSIRLANELEGKSEDEIARSLSRTSYILDYLKTGMVSIYRFAEFLKIFSPLKNSLDNVDQLVDKKWFSGYMPREESTRLLSGHAPGTFLVRFSRSSPGSFALSYVDVTKNVQHVKIPVEEKKNKNQQILYLFKVEEVEDNQPKVKIFNSVQLVIEYYREKKLLSMSLNSNIAKLR
eukprot:TRINITY_DN1495_c0_g1_i1.p1 TRINITY_DN1495_c0_g1~~TRINITY_DN1495_c0_g1_i1.p1  ORF type:complete len:367 (+),score=57.52 TRINITY_DN1495_c0_g1_i1:102-1202(+)